MTEPALQQYLIKQHPKEDEGCEWKEFKNLKNDFSGHEKDDVISYVSALANMEGGHLIVGVEDKTLKIVGTDTYNNSTGDTSTDKSVCQPFKRRPGYRGVRHGGHP